MQAEIKNLREYITRAVSPWHGAHYAAEMLENAGFCELEWGDSWHLKRDGKYYTRLYGGLVFAFTVGKGDFTAAKSLRIAAAHTDFPGFRIKPNAAMITDGYGSLNVEGYGGAILYSWLDRPLSFAGKVSVKGDSPFSPKISLVEFPRPMMIIPSLAIHMNKKVNEGMAFNKQKDMLPLVAVWGDEGNKDFFDELIAEKAGVDKEEILSYEFNIFPYENGYFLGLKEELFSSARLDNCTSVSACLDGIMSGEGEGLNIIALFDNEEIGSRSKQGAASTCLMLLLERIYSSLGYTKEDMQRGIYNGFMLSLDAAHGVHPNYTDKTDPTNRPVLNGGVVIKQAASQSYASDAEGVAIVKALCQENNIPFQQFVNRSDMPGGSTLGSIVSAQVPMMTIDVGAPLLGMHSAMETMGTEDQGALCKLVRALFG